MRVLGDKMGLWEGKHFGFIIVMCIDLVIYFD